MTTIRLRQNGPYVIDGEDVRVVDWNGVEYAVARRPIALCRCGASTKKPFCDGTHSKIGFQARRRLLSVQRRRTSRRRDESWGPVQPTVSAAAAASRAGRAAFGRAPGFRHHGAGPESARRACAPLECRPRPSRAAASWRAAS